MPARDTYHNVVRNALIKDGWIITHDPLPLQWDDRQIFVDIAADRLLTALRAGRKIAVEVKNFVGMSDIAELQQAVGQFAMYRQALAATEPDRIMYLAVPDDAMRDFLSQPMSNQLLLDQNVRLIVYSVQQEVILEWRL